jgi:hypothetical protein
MAVCAAVPRLILLNLICYEKSEWWKQDGIGGVRRSARAERKLGVRVRLRGV